MNPSAQGQRSLVWALALLNTVAYGVLYYAQPLLAVIFERTYGWTRTNTSLAFTLALLVTAFSAPTIGRRLDAQGGRLLLPLGALLGAGALFSLALSSNLVSFTAAWLLAGLAMGLTFYEATFTVLGQQVTGQVRTRATLTITLIAGLASTIFVPLTTALLEGGGLSTTLLILGSLLAGCAFLLWRTIPHLQAEGAKRQLAPFQPDATFRSLVLVFTLTRIVMVGVGLQLVPLLLWAGYKPALAATLAGLMGLSSLPGRALFVPLLTRFGVMRLSLWVVGLLSVGTVLLWFYRLPAVMAAVIALLGMMNGALTLARAELLVTHYPAEVFGTVNGRMSWFVNLAQAFTPLGVGWLFAQTGSYHASIGVLTALAVWAFITLLGLLRTSLRKVQASPL